MDAELEALVRELEAAQGAKASVRLSERNVVELVQKLREKGLLDADLLHTVSGKEYLTADQLAHEIKVETNKLGRSSLIDLSDVLGVDLYHVERLSQKVVSGDPQLMLINGEIISQSYWDSVAEEINEKLQECSQISLSEIAGQYHIGSELALSVIEPRLGTLIKGRLEGGQLYTPAYVSRITSMVRGAARGITVPTNLPIVWSALQQLLQKTNVSSPISAEGSFFQSIFNSLLKEGEMLGTLRAGVQWTPAVFAHAQRESVDSFFSQNSYVGYEVLYKLAIPQPKQYLQARYPDGIPLEGVFVHPSMVEMLDAAVGDAIDHGNWIDCLTVLPTYISGADASKILSSCSSLQKAIKSTTAVVLGECCVFSNAFIKGLIDQLEKELESTSFASLSFHGTASEMHRKTEQRIGSLDSKDLDDDSSNASVSEKGPKKKRGKVAISTKSGTSEQDDDTPQNAGKAKRNQRKGKDGSLVGASAVKSGSKKGFDKGKEDMADILPEDWIVERISSLVPDLEELTDANSLLKLLSSHIRPNLVESLMRRRNNILSENADRRRRLFDNLQKQLDEAVLDIQLYEKALELFEDDPNTNIILHKHLLKTMATPIADRVLITLDMDNKLKNGIDFGDDHNQSTSLGPAERTTMAKNLSESYSVKVQALVEALEGKRVDAFMDALREVADECGLLFKKLDKRVERTRLHSYRKDLMAQISSENDVTLLLPEVVALLFLQVYNKAIHAPGRAIGSIISLLKGKVSDPAYKILTDYHSAAVKLLSLQAASAGDEEDCSADRIRTKKELLLEMMPQLKALVLGNDSKASSSATGDESYP